MFTIAVPTILALIAAGLSIYYRPSAGFTSGIQHFAAGLVTAAVALELVPEMVAGHQIAMVIGFSAGVVLMLGAKVLADGHGHVPIGVLKAGAASTMILFVVGLDLAVDGFLLGMTLGQEAVDNLGLVVALTLEVGFLVLATTTTLLTNGVSPKGAFFRTAGITMLFPVAAVVGYKLLGELSGTLFVGTISFATAALMYLVVEELLVEAHEHEDTPLITALFFVGFLLIFIIE